jgi:L,D-transpeptidase catalytic domain
MRRHLVSATAALTAATVSLGIFVGGALAQGSGPTKPPAKHPTPTHHAKPKPKPKEHKAPPAKATASKLFTHGAFQIKHATVDVPGRTITVTGFVHPYVARQKVTLTAKVGTKLIATKALAIRPTKSGKNGKFTGKVAPGIAGILHLTVAHQRSPKLQGFHAGTGAEILAPDTSSKLFTTLVQQRLAALHIYMPMSGTWDLQTELAVTAYHRLLGRGTSSVLDPATLNSLLDGQGKFTVRFPDHGRHAEGNLSDQLIALVDGSKVERIYPISSGKPTTPTILGDYRVYLRTPGYLPDGMYYSDFFIRGYAIHGYDPAPDFPASHGCMRLPISDAISAFNWLQLGDWVDVYGAPDGSV